VVLSFVTFEIVHYYILCVDELIDVGHEVGDGFNAGFMDLLEELELGESLLVVVYDILILDSSKSVAVPEETVGVLSKSFTFPHLYLSEVVSVARVVVGCLVVRREES
jgi:hypothetical protein